MPRTGIASWCSKPVPRAARLRQRHPQLQPVEERPGSRRGLLRVGDAVAGRHQVELARPDQLVGLRGCPGAGSRPRPPGDGLQAGVGVGGTDPAVAGAVRSEVVEEAPGPDRPPPRAGAAGGRRGCPAARRAARPAARAAAIPRGRPAPTVRQTVSSGRASRLLMPSAPLRARHHRRAALRRLPCRAATRRSRVGPPRRAPLRSLAGGTPAPRPQAAEPGWPRRRSQASTRAAPRKRYVHSSASCTGLAEHDRDLRVAHLRLGEPFGHHPARRSRAGTPARAVLDHDRCPRQRRRARPSGTQLPLVSEPDEVRPASCARPPRRPHRRRDGVVAAAARDAPSPPAVGELQGYRSRVSTMISSSADPAPAGREPTSGPGLLAPSSPTARRSLSAALERVTTNCERFSRPRSSTRSIAAPRRSRTAPATPRRLARSGHSRAVAVHLLRPWPGVVGLQHEPSSRAAPGAGTAGSSPGRGSERSRNRPARPQVCHGDCADLSERLCFSRSRQAWVRIPAATSA